MSSKNTDLTHGKEKMEGMAKGKVNLITNVSIIALLILLFVAPAFAIYAVGVRYAATIFLGLLILLALCMVIKELCWPAQRSRSKEIGGPDDKLTCRNGHTVSVYVNYNGGMTQAGYLDRDVTCGASVWPKKCPICGSSWLIPGK